MNRGHVLRNRLSAVWNKSGKLMLATISLGTWVGLIGSWIGFLCVTAARTVELLLGKV